MKKITFTATFEICDRYEETAKRKLGAIISTEKFFERTFRNQRIDVQQLYHVQLENGKLLTVMADRPHNEVINPFCVYTKGEAQKKADRFGGKVVKAEG